MKVEIAKPASFYEKSQEEMAVLVSGPILIADGRILPLENSPFVKNRHPRSCLCITNEKNILFIAIDGRSGIASGMSLKELQQFLFQLNCRDAINLDGGGSTTLWINDGSEKKIINKPSDKEGERAVANILLMQEK
jgi:exopolysaccharide biosynthesis protein